jgi:CheY-like chemotaxis protein
MKGASIFLVEDEALIRMMIVEMLEELGHRVVAEAGSIETAEPLARTSVFDLAVFDINVAGFNISPIAEIVAARSLPFVFVSGYGPAGRPALFADKPVLHKPFLIEHFAELINSAMDDTSKGNNQPYPCDRGGWRRPQVPVFRCNIACSTWSARTVR